MAQGFRVTIEASDSRVIATDAYAATGCTIAPQNSWPDAPADDDKPWSIERRKSIHEWNDNYLTFIEELEGRISSQVEVQRVPGAEAAIVIGVATGKMEGAEDSLDELERLADTAGLQVIDRFLQRRKKPDHKYVVGKGKLEEIKIEWSNKKSLCVVICSNGYPEVYQKNVEITGLDKILLNKKTFFGLQITK